MVKCALNPIKLLALLNPKVTENREELMKSSRSTASGIWNRYGGGGGGDVGSDPRAWDGEELQKVAPQGAGPGF